MVPEFTLSFPLSLSLSSRVLFSSCCVVVTSCVLFVGRYTCICNGGWIDDDGNDNGDSDSSRDTDLLYPSGPYGYSIIIDFLFTPAFENARTYGEGGTLQRYTYTRGSSNQRDDDISTKWRRQTHQRSRHTSSRRLSQQFPRSSHRCLLPQQPRRPRQ